MTKCQLKQPSVRYQENSYIGVWGQQLQTQGIIVSNGALIHWSIWHNILTLFTKLAARIIYMTINGKNQLMTDNQPQLVSCQWTKSLDVIFYQINSCQKFRLHLQNLHQIRFVHRQSCYPGRMPSVGRCLVRSIRIHYADQQLPVPWETAQKHPVKYTSRWNVHMCSTWIHAL